MPISFIVKIIPLLISATHNQVSLQTSVARIKVLNLFGLIIFIPVQFSFSIFIKHSRKGNERGSLLIFFVFGSDGSFEQVDKL